MACEAPCDLGCVMVDDTLLSFSSAYRRGVVERRRLDKTGRIRAMFPVPSVFGVCQNGFCNALLVHQRQSPAGGQGPGSAGAQERRRQHGDSPREEFGHPQLAANSTAVRQRPVNWPWADALQSELFVLVGSESNFWANSELKYRISKVCLQVTGTQRQGSPRDPHSQSIEIQAS